MISAGVEIYAPGTGLAMVSGIALYDLISGLEVPGSIPLGASVTDWDADSSTDCTEASSVIKPPFATYSQSWLPGTFFGFTTNPRSVIARPPLGAEAIPCNPQSSSPSDPISGAPESGGKGSSGPGPITSADIQLAIDDPGEEKLNALHERILQIPPEDRLAVAAQFFDVADRIVEDTVAAVRALQSMDEDSIDAIRSSFCIKERRFVKLSYGSYYVDTADLRLARGTTIYFRAKTLGIIASSCYKPLNVLKNSLTLLYGAFLNPPIRDADMAKLLSPIYKNPELFRKNVLDGRGYSFTYSRGELLRALLYTSGVHHSQKKWDGDDLMVTVPRLDPRDHKYHHYLSPWPPDPENDLVISTFLQILGWTMKLDSKDDDTFTYRLNFGKTLISHVAEDGR